MPSPAPSDAALALAIDIGTSSVRAAMFDRDGTGHGGSHVRYRWDTTLDGGVEVAADTLLGATVEAIDAALAAAPERAARIVTVGVAALWHSLVGVDERGEPVTPLYAWSDTRAAAAARRLKALADERATHERTGAVFHPSYLPARLVWLSESRSDTFRRARHWMSGAEYVTLRLFGERRVSLSMASGTGLFDQHKCQWDERVLGVVPVDREQLSPLIELDTPFRELRPEFASRWPALRHLPWLAPIGDGACANVGSGCTTTRDLALSLGTSGALRALYAADSFGIPPGLWCYRLDRRRVVMGGAISNGGSVSKWLRDTLQLPGMVELDTAIARLPPDGHGLTVLPFLAGERSPDWDLDTRASFVGVSLGTQPIELVRAGLEAVAYRLAMVRQLLAPHFPDVRRIVATGGAIGGSRAWAQILSDVFGEPLVLPAEQESSARGAALLAFEAAGILGDVGDVPPPAGELITPNAAHHARFQAAIARHRALDELLSVWHSEQRVARDPRPHPA